MTRPRFSPFAASCLMALLIGALASAIVAGLMTKARAHEALPTASQPLGWTYDYSCCSVTDCREVKDSAIKEDSRGFTIVATNELIPYGDTRIRQSKDEFFHLCTIGGHDDTRALCLYTPPRGI